MIQLIAVELHVQVLGRKTVFALGIALEPEFRGDKEGSRDKAPKAHGRAEA
jgi:hypothetical protein